MYERILVPVDGSRTSLRGLNEAVALARDRNATIRLVHVVDELILSGGVGGAMAYEGDLIEQLRAGGRDILKKADAVLEAAGLRSESVMLEHLGGPAAAHIVKEAREWQADLIVLGTHGRRGIRRLVLGSDAEEIIRTTTVPVLLVRAATSEEA